MFDGHSSTHPNTHPSVHSAPPACGLLEVAGSCDDAASVIDDPAIDDPAIDDPAIENSKSDTNSTRLKNTAMAWGDRFVAAVNQALVADPTGSRSQIDENVVFNATFMGFTEGKAEQYQIEVAFDPETQKAKQKLDVFAQGSDLIFGAGGRNETAIEVLKGGTPFAESEKAKWEKDRYQYSEYDEPIYYAIKIVEASIVHGPHKDELGGPVDALEITAKGIRWVQCQPSCQCSNTPFKLSPQD